MSSTLRDRELADRRARGVIITHPNRDKPVVQATRVTVVLLLLVSAALMLINTVGGWSLLEGALPIQLAFILVYLLMAYYASRWSRGVLPIAAGLAVLLGFFALVAGPGWFARDKVRLRAGRPQLRTARRDHAADRPRANPARGRSRCAASNRAGTSRSSGAIRPRERA